MHELRRGEEIFPFARLNKVDNAPSPSHFPLPFEGAFQSEGRGAHLA